MLSISHHQAGYTLIEVLIALGLFSLISLALLATQMKALTHQQQGYYHELAVTQAQNQLQRLYAGDSINASNWQQHLQKILPDGTGFIVDGQEVVVGWLLGTSRDGWQNTGDCDPLPVNYSCISLRYAQ